jgi:sterol desaturase/sphingolipid hydroxylase (fatty acid hydroxylase superfamily)
MDIDSFGSMILLSLVFAAVACLRYLLMTGAYYIIVCKIFDRFTRKFKINKANTKKELIKKEMIWALFNNINFAIIGFFTILLYKNGYLKIYTDIDEYGVIYAIAIVPVLLVLLDTYFFWIHYFMHLPGKRETTHHKIHHQVRNISPWSAFSVHPMEGFVEILSRPLILIFIPLHPLSIAAFLIITFALNIIGHSGYEFFPRNFATHWTSRFNSSATFHYLHHQYENYNFSLFFNFWDRIMGTMHPRYEEFYEEVYQQRKETTS